VIATASIVNQDLLKELGADVAIDYTKQKFEDIAKDVDVVLDSVGGDTLARSYGAVKKGGFIVSIVTQPDRAELDEHGIGGAMFSVEPNADEFAEIGKLIDPKKIKVIVSQTFPLSERKPRNRSRLVIRAARLFSKSLTSQSRSHPLNAAVMLSEAKHLKLL
jgi:NADPH:quinone reductase-like Zn-dependent oxidoreductase